MRNISCTATTIYNRNLLSIIFLIIFSFLFLVIFLFFFQFLNFQVSENLFTNMVINYCSSLINTNICTFKSKLGFQHIHKFIDIFILHFNRSSKMKNIKFYFKPRLCTSNYKFNISFYNIPTFNNSFITIFICYLLIFIQTTHPTLDFSKHRCIRCKILLYNLFLCIIPKQVAYLGTFIIIFHFINIYYGRYHTLIDIITNI